MKAVKTGSVIKPDSRRVILKPFEPGDKSRITKIFNRISAMSENEVSKEYDKVKELFSHRHKRTEELFLKRFEDLKKYSGSEFGNSMERKLLAGSYFVSEYSLEHSALFNPSMIIHPDQSGLSAGQTRFVISMRATGEGHISSIVFREGVVDKLNNIEMAPVSQFTEMPEIENYADDFYGAHFKQDDEISERVLFPQLSSESNGMEDARFVTFTGDDGSASYYATYCAYDGHNISMNLLHTNDFLDFEIRKLKGREVKNKGMALFPRKVGGKYAMLSRQDNENNYIMFSNEIDTWEEKQLLMEPEFPWEFFQIGNCGSPIETDKGWLCFSHGVGPARRYSIGAFLLDKENPAKLIGRSREPILEAEGDEREGYVPNVVYTCGGMINDKNIIIPYAMSDYAGGFAYIDIEKLLDDLTA